MHQSVLRWDVDGLLALARQEREAARELTEQLAQKEGVEALPELDEIKDLQAPEVAKP